MKEVHITLSRESWEELESIKKKVGLDYKPKSYEEYLEDEKKKPTMALFG